MRKLFSLFSLGALILAPVVASATPITGQFSIGGSVTNNPTTTTLYFDNDVTVGPASTLYGSFQTLVHPGDAVLALNGTGILPYGSNFAGFTLFVDGVTIVLNSINGVTTCGSSDPTTCFTTFTGSVTYSAAGYDNTPGNFAFSTQDANDVTFSATGYATPVPEPSSLMLLGTGVLGAAGVLRKRFLSA